MNDERVCAVCKLSLHPFETYVCENCAVELLNGVEVSEHLRSESDGESA